MKLGTLTEMIWNYYSEGRPKATAQTFSEADVKEFAKTAFSRLMRNAYMAGKKMGMGDEYYFYSPLLSIKRFPIGEVDIKGMRRVDMGDIDLYRLPQNSHFTNVYPVGCGGTEGFEITQVSPSEENFYIGNPDFKGFKFFKVMGNGINTYNFPPCVTNVDIETTYDADDDTEISLDFCYDVANLVLSRMMGIPDFMGRTIDNPYTLPIKNLKPRPQQQDQTIE